MPKHIVLTGARGLIGKVLLEQFKKTGDSVVSLSRQKGTGYCQWDPQSGHIDEEKLKGVNVVINLAGEPIAQRWSPTTKQKILASRVDGTRLLSEALARLKDTPSVLISASAIGFYGVQRDGELDEDASRGDGFLANVCAEWEAQTAAAEEAGIRVVHVRIGVVLSKDGGALTKILPIFKTGTGGPIGNGRQQMSWVSLCDVVRAIAYCIENTTLNGPVNIVAPQPVSNSDFAKTLGAVIKRPAILTTPAFMVKAMFGEMASETILSDVKVKPKRLLDAGFEFQHPDLPSALHYILDT